MSRGRDDESALESVNRINSFRKSWAKSAWYLAPGAGHSLAVPGILKQGMHDFLCVCTCTQLPPVDHQEHLSFFLHSLQGFQLHQLKVYTNNLILTGRHLQLTYFQSSS